MSNMTNENHNNTTLQNLLNLVQCLDDSSFANDQERGQALLAAYALVIRIETPWETIVRIGMGQVCSISI